MALAAFLQLEGHEVVRMRWEIGSCYFVFKETDDLLDLVQDFVSDDAQVSPRRYNMTFAALKKRMFQSRPKTAAAATT